MTRLALLSCMWGRRELATIALGHVARFVNPRDLCVVVSTDEDEAALRAPGADAGDWFVVRFPNDRLGAKWNAGLRWLRESDADAVMILGSDDAISESVIAAAKRAISDGFDWFGLLDAYVYSVAANQMAYWAGYPATNPRHGETHGTCRTFSRRYLDAHDWKLWPDGAERGLDGESNPARTTFRGKVASVLDVGPIVDVKSDPGVDLGSFYQFENRKPVDAADVWRHFPEATVGKIISLGEVRANGHKVTSAPLIAGCLIARDEEKTIARSLASLRGIADELVVVVDSRTTDQTREIAEKCGAKVVERTFDDFASQRNAALDAATAPWAFILDADEWVERPGNIREAVEKAPDDVDAIAVSFTVADGSPNFAEGVVLQDRIIRRSHARYRFPIHHVLTGVRERMSCDGLILEHYTAADVKHSADRAIPKLEAMLDGTPEERAHALHYLARSYGMKEDWQKSREYAETLTTEVPQDAGGWLSLIIATERLEGLIAAGNVVHRAVAAHPLFAELRWWAARVQVAIMLELGSRPTPYQMVPTRASRYMPGLPGAMQFLMFSVTRRDAPSADASAAAPSAV